MEQYAGRLEGGLFSSAEDLIPVKAQQAALVPFVAVNQQQMAVGEEQHPAWRVILGKDLFGDDLVPALFE